MLTRTREQSVNERRRIIRSCEVLTELIAAGDGDAAQSHWGTHMAGLRRSLLGGSAGVVVEANHHL